MGIRQTNVTLVRVPTFKSFKVSGTDMYRLATYDFLLVFHTNHGPISYCFRDKWQFLSKIANFSHPVYTQRPPRLEFRLEFCNGVSVQKNLE